jgi:hypothetical protein
MVGIISILVVKYCAIISSYKCMEEFDDGKFVDV